MKVRLFVFLAEWTGLEPATPGVTGRYSNRLNYHSLLLLKTWRFSLAWLLCWWVLRGSNSRPTPCKGAALPTELSTRYPYFNIPLASQVLPLVTATKAASLAHL